jgi:hypothetical protein
MFFPYKKGETSGHFIVPKLNLLNTQRRSGPSNIPQLVVQFAGFAFKVLQITHTHLDLPPLIKPEFGYRRKPYIISVDVMMNNPRRIKHLILKFNI